MHLFRYTHAKSDSMKQLQDEIKTSVVTCTHTYIYMKVMYRERADSVYLHALVVST